MIEGHIVGVVGRPTHQPVAELLAEVNTAAAAAAASGATDDSDGDGDVEEGEEEEEEEEEAAAARAAGDRITTEDELGWAPSTEIDLASVPSVVDADFFMQVCMCGVCVLGGGVVMEGGGGERGRDRMYASPHKPIDAVRSLPPAPSTHITQVWTSVSEWLTGDSRAYVRRLSLAPEEEKGGEGEEAVLGTSYVVQSQTVGRPVCLSTVITTPPPKPAQAQIHPRPPSPAEPSQDGQSIDQCIQPIKPTSPPPNKHHTATLLAQPEARARRALLDARKREAALGSVLAPHLRPATDALLPLLQPSVAAAALDGEGKGEGKDAAAAAAQAAAVLSSPAKVTARVQGLLATFDLARPLPALLSSKHVRLVLRVGLTRLYVGRCAALMGVRGEGDGLCLWFLDRIVALNLALPGWLID
jgi:hypothetical protein